MKQTPEEKAAAAAEELRALIREAHEVTKALAQLMKEARTQVDGYLHSEVQAAINNYTGQMQQGLNQWNADARAEAKRVADQINEAIDQVCAVIRLAVTDSQDADRIRADIVMDLRGKVPVIERGDSERAAQILDDAPYMVVVNPTMEEIQRSRRQGFSPS